MRLGLTKPEFLQLNLRQWAALVAEYESEAKRRDDMTEVMLAQTIAMIANTGFKGWDKPRKPEEFMPTQRQKTAARPRYQSRNRVAANVEQIFAGFVQKS